MVKFVLRSSVTRMSGDQKQNMIIRNTEEERAALSALNPNKNTEETPETAADSQTGKLHFIKLFW